MGSGWSNIFKILEDTLASAIDTYAEAERARYRQLRIKLEKHGRTAIAGDELEFLQRFESTDDGRQFAQQVINDYRREEAFSRMSAEEKERHLDSLRTRLEAARAASGLYGNRMIPNAPRRLCGYCKGQGYRMCVVCNWRGYTYDDRGFHLKCVCDHGKRECTWCNGTGYAAE